MIKLKTGLNSGEYQAGEIIKLSPKEEEDLIRLGLAEKVDEPEKIEEPEKVTLKESKQKGSKK